MWVLGLCHSRRLALPFMVRSSFQNRLFGRYSRRPMYGDQGRRYRRRVHSCWVRRQNLPIESHEDRKSLSSIRRQQPWAAG